MQKPSIPKGTRDFSPEEMAKRNYIFDTIRSVFHLYGFKQIETPAMENLSTLTGKYGEEGDKLLFKILNSGDFLSIANPDDLKNRNLTKLTNQICEKGLRYDLTVPFARFVAMHRNEITFPFKRFQIQPVWRADRPQKGRYREFFQCDADIVGSNALLNEVELIQIIDEVYQRFGMNVCIKINNRKILSGIMEKIDAADKLADITVAIDKLDKIGWDGVNEELNSKGIEPEAVKKLHSFILLNGSDREKRSTLRAELQSSETGMEGVEEIETLFQKIDLSKIKNKVELDLTLARGLNYYTGAIFEVKALDVEIGSITGGGRYDNLTGVFGLMNVSGVGISFGADRIFDVLNQLNLYPENLNQQTKVLFVNFGEKEENYILPILTELRKAGINTEIYPGKDKFNKQMTYAVSNKIPYLVKIEESDMQEDKARVKNLLTGKQQIIAIQDLLEIFL
ncbi:MAG: histidine--tRNA ligase [Dysgonamonadaceae bacterium]|jgi:histidyl-tRNA synthetase|nr:histidine--tRNA ligase [Dysgonamonadaceae bacterium]